MFRRRDRISPAEKTLNKKTKANPVLVLEFLILAVLVWRHLWCTSWIISTIIHWMRAAWNYMRHRRIHECGIVRLTRDGELSGGVRSDSIMIVSINNKTGDVKIISVYRDTLPKQQDGSYEKANAAYSFGGPQEAVAMLNRTWIWILQNMLL